MSARKAGRTVVAKPTGVAPKILADIRRLIAEARGHVASTANATLTMLYWQVGQRIRTEVLRDQRAAYGERIVASVGRQLSAEYGAGFADKNLRRMLQFAEVFPDEQIVVSLIRQLSWTHFLALLPLKEPLQREFYAEMCRVQRWSVRTLRAKIGGLLYERTALSRKPANLARQELAALRDEDRLSTDLVLRDPYILDFLGLKDAYHERGPAPDICRLTRTFRNATWSGAVVLRKKSPAPLTPAIDHLFDKGFISFENKGDLFVSPVADRPALLKMWIKPGRDRAQQSSRGANGGLCRSRIRENARPVSFAFMGPARLELLVLMRPAVHSLP